MSFIIPPSVPPLAPEEIDHYRWLIGGLLTGAERLASNRGVTIVCEVVREAHDLFDELLARIEEIEADR